jgi:hypothetical protein
MRERCLCETNPSYADYGGRGISICSRWDDYDAFFDDMGQAPPGLSLERINVNLGYSPDNCCWDTSEAQGNNRRNNRILIYNGQQLTLTQWAKKIGIPPTTLQSRLSAGWSIADALCSTRIQGGKRRGVKRRKDRSDPRRNITYSTTRNTFRVHFTIAKRKRISKSFRTLEEAQDYRDQLESQYI